MSPKLSWKKALLIKEHVHAEDETGLTKCQILMTCSVHPEEGSENFDLVWGPGSLFKSFEKLREIMLEVVAEKGAVKQIF